MFVELRTLGGFYALYRLKASTHIVPKIEQSQALAIRNVTSTMYIHDVCRSAIGGYYTPLRTLSAELPNETVEPLFSPLVYLYSTLRASKRSPWANRCTRTKYGSIATNGLWQLESTRRSDASSVSLSSGEIKSWCPTLTRQETRLGLSSTALRLLEW